MKGASGFESSNLLVIFAFEVEINFGSADARMSRCGGDSVQSLACQKRGSVYVRLDQLVSKADIVGSERQAGKGGGGGYLRGGSCHGKKLTNTEIEVERKDV